MVESKKTWKMIRAAVHRMRNVLEEGNPEPGELEQALAVWAMWIDCLYARKLITAIGRLYLVMELRDETERYIKQQGR